VTEKETGSSEEAITITNVAEYLKAIEELAKYKYGKFAFRGQGEKSYDIFSSAARRLKITDSDPDEIVRFKKYHENLISNAKLKGYHRTGIMPLQELELLAELQHNGAATGLIDFTYSSLVALYFAASNMDKEHAAVHIVNTSDIAKYDHIQSNDIKKTFDTFLEDNGGKLWVWEPSNLNNRIPKQHSLFIFGKPGIDEEFSVGVIQIHSEAKSQIINELQNYHNIDAFSLFNDLTGFAKENSYKKPYMDPEFLKIMFKVNSYLLVEGTDPLSQIELLNRAIKLDKNSIEPLMLRSIYNMVLEDHHGVIDDTNRLIELWSDNPGFYLARARSEIQLKDFEGGREDLKKTLELSPDDEESLRLLERLNNEHPEDDGITSSLE